MATGTRVVRRDRGMPWAAGPATLALELLALAFLACTPSSVPVERFSWDNVPMLGGGSVTGIVFHPTAPGVRYARTDIGGAYR